MQIIPRHVHGVLDYVVGLLLIFAPQLFGFDTGGVEQRISMVLGLAAFVYSLMTNYELGLFKILPFKFHLLLDVFNGVLLALSPWLFAFSNEVWIPHVLLGSFEVLAVLLTKTSPADGLAGSPRGQA
ncbi:MAG: hypothetical protein QM790_08065 [Nibricoccus sp.]